jgi:hypothetical protein
MESIGKKEELVFFADFWKKLQGTRGNGVVA